SFPLAGGGSLSASQFLNLFLFPPEQQYTYLSKLSGGEKKRLQLLSILFRNPNFLILDEPTNDLDLPTLSVLENFLSDFQGCMLIVSHDRYFMDRLVDHLFVFEGDGAVRDFPGNYSDYRIWQREEERIQLIQRENEAKLQNITSDNEVPVKEKKKLSFKEKREFEQLEKEIASLEQEKITITEQMSSNQIPYEQVQKLSARI